MNNIQIFISPWRNKKREKKKNRECGLTYKGFVRSLKFAQNVDAKNNVLLLVTNSSTVCLL